MSNLAIGFNNRAAAGTYSGGSWMAALPASNMADSDLGLLARSSNAKRTSTRVRCKLASVSKLRAVALAAHNMSSAARWRVRAGKAPLDLLFDDPSQLDSRVTFSGGTNGTVINAKGRIVRVTRTNLLLQCLNPSNASWTKTAVATSGYASNMAGYPGVPWDAEATTFVYAVVPSVVATSHYISQSFTPTETGPHTISAYAMANGYANFAIEIQGVGYAYFDADEVEVTNSSGLSDSSIEPAAGGWARAGVMANLTAGTPYTVNCYVAPVRNNAAAAGDGSKGTFLIGMQAERNAAATDLITTTAATVTATASGRISYGSRRENLLPYSEALSTWTMDTGCSVTSNATTAPDGQTTADLLVEANATVVHRAFSYCSGTAGKVYTASCYAKAEARTQCEVLVSGLGGVVVNLSTGALLSSSLETGVSYSIGTAVNGWYRISVTGPCPSNGLFVLQLRVAKNGTATYAGTSAGGIYFWGMQINAGALGYYLSTASAARADLTPWRTNYANSSNNFQSSATVTASPGEVPPPQGHIGQTTRMVFSPIVNANWQLDSFLSPVDGRAFTYSVWVYSEVATTIILSVLSVPAIQWASADEVRSVGPGWSRIQMTAAPTGVTTDTVLRLYLLTRDGVARDIHVYGMQLEKYIEATDYIPTTSAAVTAADECLGLLREKASTNMLLYSSQFDDPAWKVSIETGSTITANAAQAPDGAMTADVYVRGNTTNFAYAPQQLVGDASQALTFSVWMRVGAAGANSVQLSISDINLATLNSANFTLTGEWQRLSFSVNTGALSNTGFIGVGFLLSPGQTVQLWGAQLEVGSFATSYIPTAGTAVTRSADSYISSGASFAGWYTQGPGTLYVEFSSGSTLACVAASLDNATTDEEVGIYSDAGSLFAFTRDGGVVQSSLNCSAAPPIGGFSKLAIAYAANDAAAVVNGGALVVDATGTLPTPTQLTIGDYPSTAPLNGCIKRITYWPERLTNSELQAITTDGPDAIGGTTGWLDALQFTFNADIPDDWGDRYAAIGMLAAADFDAQYLTVEIDDTANVDGYVQIGQLFAGECFQPAYNASRDGFGNAREDLSSAAETAAGVRFGIDRRRRRVARFALKFLNDPTEADRIHELQDTVGTLGDVVYIPDPADMAKSQRYGFLGYMRTLGALEYPLPLKASVPFEIAEKL